MLALNLTSFPGSHLLLPNLSGQVGVACLSDASMLGRVFISRFFTVCYGQGELRLLVFKTRNYSDYAETDHNSLPHDGGGPVQPDSPFL